jgi:hypothetical protein
MYFPMIDPQIFSGLICIYSMHRAFRHCALRSTEYRGLVHVNPHPKNVGGAPELIIRVEGTPELGGRFTEIIHPYTLSRPALAIVREASSLSVLDKNLDTWYLSSIFEHEGVFQGCCLGSHKIKVIVRDVRVSNRHQMSLRFFYLSDHFLKGCLIELLWIENKVHSVFSIEKVKPESIYWESMLIE